MKTASKVWLIILAIIILGVVSLFAIMGYIPGLSTLFGTNKPRDLGITYTKADFTSAHNKSAVTYATLPPDTPASASITFSDSHAVETSWNSAEMTALLNNRPWKYWPISNVQMKINNDGTVEMSGIIDSEKLEGYAAAIGVPTTVADRTSLLPTSAAFYIKGTSSLNNNRVSTFDITSAELGRMPISTNLLLSYNTIRHAYADDISNELSKYSGKKAAIVDFINQKLDWISGFFAKSASFSNGKLQFDGTLPDEELSVQ